MSTRERQPKPSEVNARLLTRRQAIGALTASTVVILTGNVVDEKGNAIADGYAIIPVDGVRVGIIGMVTPNIMIWDEENLDASAL